MIVLILAGGLGNQMFEYAAGKAMALRSKTDLVVNNQLGFKRDKVYNRVYSLGHYNVSYKKQKLLTFDFPGGFIVSKLSAKLGRHILFPWYRYVTDNRVAPQILKDHPNEYKNVIMSGTFVFPEYFDDQKEIILNEFSLRQDAALPFEALKCLKKIVESPVPVVALCARIYQEIKNPELRQSEFYAQSEYYNKALDYMKENIGKFKLLIFSQAKDWVKENVNLENIDYEFVNVSTTDRDAAFEMYVLSKCHHYIISNSSYYFWGVYLNQDDKKVIIPKQWTTGVLPEWIKI